eukprot:12453096-Ditylum_brightwellii.AAC.1
MERSKQNKHLACNKDDDVDSGDDDSDGGANKHLTHLTQIKNNGHVTHFRFFGKMPVSKNAILRLRGGGLKDDQG